MGRWNNPITRDQLLPLLAAGARQIDIAKALGKNDATVWAALKKFGLWIKPKRTPAREDPICAKCGCTDRTNFLRRTGHDPNGKPKNGWCSWCKDCSYERVRLLKTENRRKILEYLGGKCVVCGFNEYSSALDIHHNDPAKKDPKFDDISGWTWSRVEKEIQKCILLCSNHHRAFHNDELSTEDRGKIPLTP